MAKTNVTKIALYAGVGYVAWTMARNSGNPDLIKLTDSIKKAFGGGLGRAGEAALGPNGAPSGGGGGTHPGIAANPNFWAQVREWQAATSGSKDWARFRTHVVEIGAPDPGENPPAGW